MTFRALSRQTGSIGAEMYSSNLINILLAETKKKTPKRTALEIVDSVMNVNNLSKDVMDKYDTYRRNISKMDLAAAARYTSNFYKKGLSTYVPVGAIA